MFKTVSLAALSVVFCGVAAAGTFAPPERVECASEGQYMQVQSQQMRSRQQDSNTYNASRLEPSAEDMAKARAAREKSAAKRSKDSIYVSNYGTRIEERHDQNNRLTEIRVTPGTTQIPYTMKNTSDRPIDDRPGADPRSTVDTPKFIQFGW